MQDLTRAQKARVAIQSFKTLANALALRGYFRPSGRMGQALTECLLTLSPEIYGSMNDPRVVELKGLEYVIDRLPKGIEKSTRIILTDEEQFGESQFEKIIPLKRRRSCYRISETEFCFVVTRGITEIYDILTHITFLNIEAKKIQSHMIDGTGNISYEWNDLEKTVQNLDQFSAHELDRALWNLSIILGRSYHETRDTYEYFAKNKKERNSNSDLFSMIYQLGKRVDEETKSKDNFLIVYMTPTLMNIIAHQYYGKKWSDNIKTRLKELNLHNRPLHIISANLHSVVNLLYGYGTTCHLPDGKTRDSGEPLYDFIQCIREKRDDIIGFAGKNGFYELSDSSGSNIDVQIIDTACLACVPQHPVLKINSAALRDNAPVILVMDYAFGAQAFEVMDCLLMPYDENLETPLKVKSISIMGKAGILPGKKGDIMLATAHVMEGSTDNYMVENDLKREDFDPDMDVYVGPVITVLGTSLQNRDLLQRFQTTWKTVGLEMEGGYYQRAISAAIIRRHISKDVKVRYAYYASDNPLLSGQTLAAGEMGAEGIRPTYMVTKVILEKILGSQHF
jgi:hypothetical protein